MATKKKAPAAEQVVEDIKQTDIPVETKSGGGTRNMETPTQPKKGIDLRNNSLEREIKSKQPLLVSGTNIKTINGESVLGTGNLEVDRHFKGWWPDLATLKAAVTATPGDAAYVKDASPATTWSIYEYDSTASSDNYWADSGTDADTSNVQTFETGEAVNEVPIDDTHLANAPEGSLPLATDAQLLAQKLRGIDLTETKQSYTLEIGYVNYNGSINGTTTKHTVIALGDAKRVRFLGQTISGHSGNNYSYAFWNAATYTDSSTVVSSKYYDIRTGSTSEPKEYIVDIPIGATHIAITVSSVTESSFYCYLESGDNVIDKIGKVMPIVSEELYHSYNLIDPNKITTKVRLLSSNGNTTSTSSSDEYVTGLIEIPPRGLYAKAINGSSSGGFASWCLYDKNGDYIPNNIEGVDRCGYDETVTIPYNPQYYKYVRLHSTTSYNYCVAVECNADGTAPVFTGLWDYRYNYYEEQTIKFSRFKDRLSVADCMPELLPSLSMCGSNAIKVTAESLEAGTVKSIADFPNKLRNCFTYTAKMSLAEALPIGEYIRVGNNRNGTIGRTIEITPTNINFLRYVAGTTNDYVTDATATHGLTIADFLMVEMDCDYTSVTVRIASSDGFFKKTFALNAGYDIWQNQGTPYIIASVNLTDVTFKATSKMFLKPVWTIGASYTVLDPKRWTWQMVNTIGFENFFVSGMAGDESGTLPKDDSSQHNNSNSAFYNLQKCLNFGTPKYLFWEIGMNDATDGRFIYYAKRIEAICRAKGIELIYATIPNAVNEANTSIVTNKSYINNYVKNSGYRYVDFYGAMCGSNGLWREGYCDDGVHPTELGAKVQAAQVLVDFPEIANY